MELDELHVGNPAASAPGHRDAIAGGGIGVGRVKINLTRAAGSQNSLASGNGFYVATLAVEHVGTQTTIFLSKSQLANFAGRNQIHHDVMFHHVDIAVITHLRGEGVLNRRTCCIIDMDHSAMTVAAFTGQVIATCFAGKGHAAVDQPLNGFTGMLNGKARGGRIVQVRTGHQGVCNMILNRVRAV